MASQSLQAAQNSVVGFGDGTSLGIANLIRKALGLDEEVQYGTRSYAVGGIVGGLAAYLVYRTGL
jgi:hypothetical protein